MLKTQKDLRISKTFLYYTTRALNTTKKRERNTIAPTMTLNAYRISLRCQICNAMRPRYRYNALVSH